MGVIKDIRQELRSLGEDAKDVKEGIISEAKAYKEARRRAKNSPKVPYKTKLKSRLKKVGRALRVDKKIKVINSRLKYLNKKIDSGDATLEDKLEYRKLKSSIKQLPIQAGISAARTVTLSVAPALYPLGYLASGIASAAGNKIVGSDNSNQRLAQRVKEGKDLSPSERYKLRQANKLGEKSRDIRAMSDIIKKSVQKKKK